MVVAKIDEYGKAGWIGLMVLGFWLAWPVGLMMLAFLIGSGRIGSGRFAAGRGQWLNMSEQAPGFGSGFGSGFGAGFGKWGRATRDGARAPASASGNKAFDEYRDETLRRLETEEREFQDFLDRLRKARDKSEFDAFMAERRDRASPVSENAGSV